MITVPNTVTNAEAVTGTQVVTDTVTDTVTEAVAVSQDLINLEACIYKNAKAWVKIGKALFRIKEDALFQERGFTSVHAYASEIFDFTKVHCYRLINGYRVNELLINPNEEVTLPLNESQVRPLTNLLDTDQEDDIRVIWGTIEGKITATKVKDAYKEYYGVGTVTKEDNTEPDSNNSITGSNEVTIEHEEDNIIIPQANDAVNNVNLENKDDAQVVTTKGDLVAENNILKAELLMLKTKTLTETQEDIINAGYDMLLSQGRDKEDLDKAYKLFLDV